MLPFGVIENACDLILLDVASQFRICVLFHVALFSHNASFSRNLRVVFPVVKLSDSETTGQTTRKLSAGMTCYAYDFLNEEVGVA